MTWWWLSTPAMTVAVAVKDGRIVNGPPIVSGFIGSRPKNLGRWLRKQGDLRVAKLNP